MFYQNELSFLCEILRKHRVRTDVIEQGEWEHLRSDREEEDIPGRRALLTEVLPTLEARTSYRLTDAFECNYRFLLLPHMPTPTALIVGPYLSAPVSATHLTEIGEANGILPQRQGGLSEFYAGLPVLAADSPLFTVFNTFCERIWNSPSYSIKDITGQGRGFEEPFSRSMMDIGLSDTLVKMKAMERRYAFENDLLRAVSLGQIHIENRLFSAFSEQAFEKRVPDRLRNAQNYCIIMNTLLRKAAEKGGVHPFHLDRVSSEFATKIQDMTQLSQNNALMRDMFRTYCRLVRDHSIKHFSSTVQKTILMIDGDLSADLSAARLALSQGVSEGYLCTVFKKETGKTMSEYIRERRMEYATYLLGTTDLQIQTVAMHCGIMDVQYFSKLFKRQLGMTPSEYRQTRKRDIPIKETETRE